jgi:outer membrane protein assembly factor BamB
MPSMMRRSIGVLLWVSLASGAASAAERESWSRFRGPNGTGVSEATGLPVSFGPEKNVRWKTPLPPGHSSPVLSESRIFLTAHSPDKKGYRLFVIGLDRKTGRELWRREVPRTQTGRRENVNGPASPSPVTDGANVYAFFQEFGLISYTADGRERWRKPIGPFNMFYGFGASPMLADGTLVLRRKDRSRALEDAEAPRHLRLFDADDLSSGDRWRAASRARVVPAHRLRSIGRQAGVVGPRPRM